MARTNVKLFSMECSGPLIWNYRPEFLTNTQTLRQFKIQPKRCLICPHEDRFQN